MIGESSGCVDATSARIITAWKGFRQLLPIIINCGISLRNQGNIFSSYIRKTLLCGCETWSSSRETIRRLTSSNNGMVCWICGVRLEQRIITQELHKDFNIRKELADERVE